MLSGLLGTVSYFWASYACLLIGVAYLFAARPGTPVWQRVLGALYAPVAAALFVAATLTDFGIGPLRGLPLFLALQALPLALLLLSVRSHAVPRRVVWILLPPALVCWGWQVLWGCLGMAG